MVSYADCVFVGEQHATEHVREAFDYHRREIDSFLCICPTFEHNFFCLSQRIVDHSHQLCMGEILWIFLLFCFLFFFFFTRPRTLLTLPESSHSRNVGTETLLFMTETVFMVRLTSFRHTLPHAGSGLHSHAKNFSLTHVACCTLFLHRREPFANVVTIIAHTIPIN